MECKIILLNQEFHLISFFRRLASGLQRCRPQPIVAIVLIQIIIPWNKQLSQEVVVTHGRCHEGTEDTIVFHSVEIPLQQKKGRTFHLTTAAISSGEPVVQ